ncbi:MAG: hypothetical protein H7A33_00690 [Deltaproteobacteria bacterium]|nr:hypothetical protein [Deltaproteobacteria bacterium]
MKSKTFLPYITDDFENLVGVISLKQLLQVLSKRVLKEFMIRMCSYCELV